MTELLEKLAELEHLQWCEWSKSIAKTAWVPKVKLKQWEEYWRVPYKDLPEEVKELDRAWARKVLEVIEGDLK